MNLFCLDSNDSTWSQLLIGNSYDIYHLPEYAEADAKLSAGKGIAICVEDGPFRLLVPLVLEVLPGFTKAPSGFRDAHSPYGYASPLLLSEPGSVASSEETERFLGRAMPLLLQKMRSLGIVSAFIRLHPHLPIPRAPLETIGSVVDRGWTVAIDLTQPDEELRKQLRKDHRKDIQRLEREGYEVHITEDLSELDTFREIYADTMRRVNASEYYYFSDEHFEYIRKRLAKHYRLGSVRIGDEVVAMHLFSEVNGFVESLIGGTRTTHVKQSPAKALYVATQWWAKARGNHTFDLGGGIGPGGENNSLFKYKLGFSNRKYPFATWHIISDPRIYSQLVCEWQTAHGGQGSPPSNFFPQYRTPIEYRTPLRPQPATH